MLGLLPTILATDEMYPVLNRDNLTTQFRFNYLRNTKSFAIILRHFLNLDEILNIFTKKMMLIDFIILKIRTPKT